MKKPITQILKPIKKSIGGQRVPHFKNTDKIQTVTLPCPERVVIPTAMHIGAPCDILVEKGERVLVGQVIADSKSPVSAPIHASISGTVEAIGNVDIAGGRSVQAITILSDGLMEASPDIAPKTAESFDEFISHIRASGLVGLGGAGFPASVKLNPKTTVDTLIINAAECEPYITSDYREIIECSDSLFDGVHLISRFLNIENIIICVESNKPKALELLAKIAASDDASGDKIKIMRLPSHYPQGAEKVLIYSATGRIVPAGKLPSDVGCIVMNITSVSFIGKYFKTGMPLISKRITVDGDAIVNRQNLIVPIGTRAKDVLAFCGMNDDCKKLIMGGPMMGIAMFSDEMPIQKQTNALLALSAKKAALPTVTDCIRCARCMTTCPMGLAPMQVEQAMAARDNEKLARLGVMSCMECGCCSYGCPAKRPLVQSMRLAKQKLKEGK